MCPAVRISTSGKIEDTGKYLTEMFNIFIYLFVFFSIFKAFSSVPQFPKKDFPLLLLIANQNANST